MLVFVGKITLSYNNTHAIYSHTHTRTTKNFERIGRIGQSLIMRVGVGLCVILRYFQRFITTETALYTASCGRSVPIIKRLASGVVHDAYKSNRVNTE